MQVDAVAVAEEVCAATQVDGVALPLSSVRQDTSAVVRRLLARIEDSGAPQPLPSSVDFFGHESDPTRARIADADAASTGFRPGRGQLLSDETEALVRETKRETARSRRRSVLFEGCSLAHLDCAWSL